MKKSNITLGPLLQLEGHVPGGGRRTMDFGNGRTHGLILAHTELKKMVLIYPRQTTKIPTGQCRPLVDTYTDLHEGAAPNACFRDRPRHPHGKTKIVLVHDAITYQKRTAEPDEHPYRHKYELAEEEKPTLLVDEAGEYFVGNQNWIIVTEGGIEDRGSRSNPKRSPSIVDYWWAR